MATVEDILIEKGSDVIGTTTSTTVRRAVHKMAEANVGCLLIEENERAVGIFTERDLLRRVVDAGRDPDSTIIGEVMSSPVETCKGTDDLEDCADTLSGHRFRHLVVTDKDEPVGVISLRDLFGWVHNGKSEKE